MIDEGMSENRFSVFMRALLALIHIANLFACILAWLFHPAPGIYVVVAPVVSLYILYMIVHDGCFVRENRWRSWGASSVWHTRQEDPFVFWLQLLVFQILPILAIVARGKNNSPSLAASLPWGELLFFGYIALFLAALVLLAWFVLPLSVKVRFPKLAFMFNRDFYLFSLFALYAKVAKVDGQVSSAEIRQIVDVMNNTLELSRRETDLAQSVFLYFKNSSLESEDIAKLCAEYYEASPAVLTSIVDLLLWLAVADGNLHPSEHNLVVRIAEIFGITGSRFNKLREDNLRDAGLLGEEAEEHAHEKRQERRQTEQSRSSAQIPRAYLVLDCKPNDPWETIKSNYHRLLKENHPDRLASKKLPKQILDRAKRRTQEIIEAFDELREVYGKK